MAKQSKISRDLADGCHVLDEELLEYAEVFGLTPAQAVAVAKHQTDERDLAQANCTILASAKGTSNLDPSTFECVPCPECGTHSIAQPLGAA